MSLGRYLRAALDKFCWCRYDKGCEAACGAGKEDFRERVWRGGRVGEERERAVVGHEEEGIECAITEDRCCCAYAEH